MTKNNYQSVLFITSIILILLIYFFIDIFYIDLPPYSIDLKEVNTYIYFHDKNNIEVYSYLTYESNFFMKTPLKGNKINLIFPFEKSNIKEIQSYYYKGFKTIDLIDNQFQGTIDYKDIKNNLKGLIYLKAYLKTDEYVHYLDLPVFWSNKANIKHYVIFNKDFKIFFLSIFPTQIIEKDNSYYLKIENKSKQPLKIKVFQK